MGAQLSAHGRLVTDVQIRTTRQETKMAFTRMAVTLPCHRADAGQETFWLGVVAFGSVADSLAGHKKADMLSVSGSMQMTHWTDRDGTQHTGYQIVADAVISARTVRPDGGTRTAGNKNSVPAIPTGGETGQHMAGPADYWEIYRQGADGDAFDQRPPFDETE